MDGMKMVSMKMTPAMRTKMAPETVPVKEAEGPEYPWGSRVTIEDDHVSGMGLEGAKGDDELEIVGKAKVLSTRSEDMAGGKKRRSVELQITDMGVRPAVKKRAAADVLYGKGEKPNG